MIINIKSIHDAREKSLKCAIVGVAMGMGYCPDVFGWEVHEGCGGDPTKCIKCWDDAQRKADGFEV